MVPTVLLLMVVMPVAVLESPASTGRPWVPMVHLLSLSTAAVEGAVAGDADGPGGPHPRFRWPAACAGFRGDGEGCAWRGPKSRSCISRTRVGASMAPSGRNHL